MHAVDRPIDELTCAAICERAGVSRQLFYRYFDSKFDIPFWYTLECDRASIAEIGRTLTWREGLEDFFTLLYDERDTFRHFAASKDSRAARHRADDRRSEVFSETIALNGGKLTDDLIFFSEMYANSFNKALALWISDGMTRSPVHMAQLLYELAPLPLREAVCPSQSDKSRDAARMQLS